MILKRVKFGDKTEKTGHGMLPSPVFGNSVATPLGINSHHTAFLTGYAWTRSYIIPLQ